MQHGPPRYQDLAGTPAHALSRPPGYPAKVTKHVTTVNGDSTLKYMDTASNVAGLVDLGLTRYEARAYLALIGRQDATPAEIARNTPIPRQRVYDVLASLAERGVVVQVPGQALRYRAQPPDRVAERLVAVRRRELDRVADTAGVLADELLPLYRSGLAHASDTDYVEVLRDAEHAVQRVEQLWAAARGEVVSLVRSPYLAPPVPEDATVTAGVVQRAIYERSMLDDARMSDLVHTFADLGEQVRVAEGLPLKLTVVDERSVAFNMPNAADNDSSATTLVVHNQALAATLMIAFEVLWSQATPLADVE